MSQPIDFPAIAGLVIFILTVIAVIVLVLKPLTVPVPRTTLVVPISYCWAPVLGVALMLACTSLSWRDVGIGISGDDRIQPYGILILFMSMAYIASSLDATGLFAWLALKITYASRGNGSALFLFYFCLTCLVTTFTSNDVTILTLTPIICYFARATNTDPVPFLIAEFSAANIFGMILYVGNPTNIIVADAYNMTFLGYSKYMALPTLAAGVVCYLIYLFRFWRQIPKSVTLPTVDASTMLTDKLGAVVGSVNMLACLALLAAAPSLKWTMWVITIVCAAIHMAYNFWALMVRNGMLQAWWANSLLRDTGSQARKRTAQGVVTETAGSKYAVAQSHQEDLSVKNSGVNGAVPQITIAGHQDTPKELSYLEEPQHKKVSCDSCSGVPPPLSHDLDLSTHEQVLATRTVASLAIDGGMDSKHDVQLDHPMVNGADNPSPVQPRSIDSIRSATLGSSASSMNGVQLYNSKLGTGSNHTPGSAVPSGVFVYPNETQTHAAAVTGVHLHVAAAAYTEPYSAATTAEHKLYAVAAADVHSMPYASQVQTAERNSNQQVAEGDRPSLASVGGIQIGPKQTTFAALFWGLPWEVVPFVLGMFVMVQCLDEQGWVERLGEGLGQGSESLPAAVMLMGWLSVILANMINNQPMTILLTRVALSENFVNLLGSKQVHGAALFALVAASNVGAIYTLIGALAGIMWAHILRTMDIPMSYGRFVWLAMPTGIATTVACLLIIWGEFAAFSP